MSNINKKSLYDILGVNNGDSCNEIKKAYLKLAREHHPDKGGDAEKFKEIQRASEVLIDENKRRMYDEFGTIEGEQGMSSPSSGGGAFSFPFEVNMNDFFGNIFGGGGGVSDASVRKGKKAPPSTKNINITLQQFYFGHNFNININRQCFCAVCEHTGAKSKETCKLCNGRGVISQIIQVGPMVMHTSGPCVECSGKGERILVSCEKCSGTGFLSEQRSLSIKIVPGTRSGDTFIFPEMCSDHVGFERPGDAHIIITEDETDSAFKTFKRIGDKLQHLESNITLSLAESLMGCVVKIDGHPGYEDGLFIQIPAGSFQGDKYCLSGFGMPLVGDIGKYGDLFINIHVTVSPNERRLLSTNGRELLGALFEDKVRKTECAEDSIQKGLYLQK